MSGLKIFENAEFGRIRTAQLNDKSYFVGKDIANALGYSNPRDAISRHCKDVVKHDNFKEGGREVALISEGDMYRLITHSKLESAERFEKWVFDEVLPSIRKNGGYILGQEKMSDDELLSKALLVAQNKIAERDKVITEKQHRIEQMRPKAIFADAVATSSQSILIGDLAKLICQNGVKIGQNRLFEWMYENGYLIRSGCRHRMPTQKAMELKLFEVKERAIDNPDGSVRLTRTTKVTGKGQQYFINKLLATKKQDRNS